jgi:putative transposase
VRKTYQTSRAEASAAADAVMPETATIALGEIAESAKEGLLALAVGAGLQVMAAMMAASVTALCGPKGRQGEPVQDPRAAHRSFLRYRDDGPPWP